MISALEDNKVTNIRNFVLEDLAQVKILIVSFYNESLKHYGITLDDKTLEETLMTFLNPNIGIVAELDEKIIGCIGGVACRSIFNKNQIIAQESMWYVNKEFRHGTIGVRLIKAFKDECKARGASLLSMVSMRNLNANKMNDFYTKSGFRSMETHFIKGI